jgi:hypothetical protein
MVCQLNWKLTRHLSGWLRWGCAAIGDCNMMRADFSRKDIHLEPWIRKKAHWPKGQPRYYDDVGQLK